jgi:hypothetical protein
MSFNLQFGYLPVQNRPYGQFGYGVIAGPQFGYGQVMAVPQYGYVPIITGPPVGALPVMALPNRQNGQNRPNVQIGGDVVETDLYGTFKFRDGSILIPGNMRRY